MAPADGTMAGEADAEEAGVEAEEEEEERGIKGTEGSMTRFRVNAILFKLEFHLFLMAFAGLPGISLHISDQALPMTATALMI